MRASRLFFWLIFSRWITWKRLPEIKSRSMHAECNNGRHLFHIGYIYRLQKFLWITMLFLVPLTHKYLHTFTHANYETLIVLTFFNLLFLSVNANLCSLFSLSLILLLDAFTHTHTLANHHLNSHRPYITVIIIIISSIVCFHLLPSSVYYVHSG